MNSKKYFNWMRGANNVDDPQRLPEGFAQGLVNFDVTASGGLTLRQGMQKIYSGNPRGVLSLGHKLLIADGSDLVEVNTLNQAVRVLRSISQSGRFVGCEHNARLYLCTETECLEYDGTTVRPWGVPVALNSLLTTPANGGLIDAHYRLAITYSDDSGREGGTDAPLVMRAAGGLTIDLPDPPSGHLINFYASSPNGDVLYLQHSSSQGGQYLLNRVRDDTRALSTINKYAPTPSDRIVSHNGVIAMARGSLLELTMPMRAHLVDRVSGFFQYPSSIGEIVSAGALFVSADKSYALLMPETGEAIQRVIAEYPAIAGTGATLPSGAGIWLTSRGYVLLNGESAEPVTEQHFVPAPAKSGASGVTDNAGAPRIITTTRSHNGQNRLAALDRFTAEIRMP